LLGARVWKWLHRIGLYPLAILFTGVSWLSLKLSLSGRPSPQVHAPHTDAIFPAVLVSLMAVAFALRIFVFIRSVLRRRTTSVRGATSSLASQ
jgi:hypothetical protein